MKVPETSGRATRTSEDSGVLELDGDGRSSEVCNASGIA